MITIKYKFVKWEDYEDNVIIDNVRTQIEKLTSSEYETRVYDDHTDPSMAILEVEIDKSLERIIRESFDSFIEEKTMLYTKID